MALGESPQQAILALNPANTPECCPCIDKRRELTFRCSPPGSGIVDVEALEGCRFRTSSGWLPDGTTRAVDSEVVVDARYGQTVSAYVVPLKPYGFMHWEGNQIRRCEDCGVVVTALNEDGMTVEAIMETRTFWVTLNSLDLGASCRTLLHSARVSA
jgi:hypothetical protein